MICGISNEELLIASHIKEFCHCEPGEHIDSKNGLLLCANHDKLFDKHLISFNKEGDILISNKIKLDDYTKLQINKQIKIDKEYFDEKYMMIHRSKLEK